jgi:RNA polymerase sigma-70 factor, ECF subfamily
MAIVVAGARLGAEFSGLGKQPKSDHRTMSRLLRPSKSVATRSPEELLAEAGNAGLDTFLEIYDAWAPRVLGLIRRILPDADESEQVLEEVFRRLWCDSGRILASGGSVAAWLTLTARARALGRLRNAGRAPSKAERAGNIGGASPEALAWLPAPECIACIDERRVLLQKVLSQLPRQQLKALELVAYSGQTELDLVNELGEPLARVQALLRAAAQFLRHRRQAVVGSWTVSI